MATTAGLTRGGHDGRRPRPPAAATAPAAAPAAWAQSLVLFVQVATIWVTLQAAQARRRLREVTSAVLVVSAAAAILNLFLPRGPAGDGAMAVVSGLLYLAAPGVIVRHMVWRRTVDTQTVLGRSPPT